LLELTREQLDALPMKNGFRLRGMEMTRTETFTDAAFAFALTLLVISVDSIPANYAELIVAVQGIPAFGLSCMLLFLFWHGHWNWSRRYGLEDFPSMILSFFLVFVMLCYVYPMKFVTSSFVEWVSGQRIDTSPDNAPIANFEELFGIFTIYSVGFVALCLAVLLLYWHAWRRREELELNDVERYVTRSEIGSWSILIGVGVLAILMGLFAPRSMLTMPGWAYTLLPVIMPAYGMLHSRRLARLRNQTATDPPTSSQT
jgi:uncharacterized membrane protein